MTVEAATYIAGLDPLAPDGTTQYVYEGDNHLRLIKDVLLESIPLEGKVIATYTELNLNSGWTYRGSAASKDAGSGVGNVCLLGSISGVPALPSVDGSQVFNVATTDTLIADVLIEQLRNGLFTAFHFSNH